MVAGDAMISGGRRDYGGWRCGEFGMGGVTTVACDVAIWGRAG
jgi:hypothetical protein